MNKSFRDLSLLTQTSTGNVSEFGSTSITKPSKNWSSVADFKKSYTFFKQKGYEILESVFISITENAMYLRTLQMFYSSFNNSVFHIVTLHYIENSFLLISLIIVIVSILYTAIWLYPEPSLLCTILYIIQHTVQYLVC